jgi:MuDR family transposase
MASLHELRELLVQGDYFISFEDLLEVIRDASIKHKFSFKTLHKDPKRARYKCSNRDCLCKVNAHLNPNDKNEIIVDTVSLVYTYISDAAAKGEAASCQGWIDSKCYRLPYGYEA